MLVLLLGLAAGVHPPAQDYALDLRVCRGDPLGTRAEGLVKYLAEPRLVTRAARPAYVLAGELPPGGAALDPGEAYPVRLAVRPTPGPFGTVWLDVTGGGTCCPSSRVVRLVPPGQWVRVRVAADSPASQTWLEVRLTPRQDTP